MQDHSKSPVCYFYNPDIGEAFYGLNHPMKPQRVVVTHNLVMNYNLLQFMRVYRPLKAHHFDMEKFHTSEYVNFLRNIRPDNLNKHTHLLDRYNINEDNPFFEGMYEFCQYTVGGSLAAANTLNKKESDMCINWSGGLHHAKKSEASGFCYMNDIVLCILELLKYNERVLYVDIDVHHGDGVEEAFYTTDRVLTVSFHKFGDNYFPGTGDLREIGAHDGTYYSLNVPLDSGITNQAYQSLFEPIIAKVMENYRPSVVVMQCGADSLAGDHLGVFNLTLKGHGKCIEFVKKFNVPMMLVGGGGYCTFNVARCWTYDTSVVLGKDISNKLPVNEYYKHFGPHFKLHINPSKQKDRNKVEALANIKETIFENLRMLPHAPGVQMQPIPEDAIDNVSEDEDNVDKNERYPQRDRDKRIVPDNEYYDSDDDGPSTSGGVRRYKVRDFEKKTAFVKSLTMKIVPEIKMEVDDTEEIDDIKKENVPIKTKKYMGKKKGRKRKKNQKVAKDATEKLDEVKAEENIADSEDTAQLGVTEIDEITECADAAENIDYIEDNKSDEDAIKSEEGEDVGEIDGTAMADDTMTNEKATTGQATTAGGGSKKKAQKKKLPQKPQYKGGCQTRRKYR